MRQWKRRRDGVKQRYNYSFNPLIARQAREDLGINYDDEQKMFAIKNLRNKLRQERNPIRRAEIEDNILHLQGGY